MLRTVPAQRKVCLVIIGSQLQGSLSQVVAGVVSHTGQAALRVRTGCMEEVGPELGGL